MDSKSELGAAGDCEMYAFKFSLLAALAWVFAFILANFNRLHAECALMHDTCVLKELRSDSINAVKFYRILRSLNLNLARRI